MNSLISVMHTSPADTVVYLSGPMQGYPNFNTQMFLTAEKYIRECHEHLEIDCPTILNPAKWPEQPSHEEYMKFDLAMIIKHEVDVIMLLPGFPNSKGSFREEMQVREIGGIVVEYMDWLASVRMLLEDQAILDNTNIKETCSD